ncbi:RnfH family protein [Oleiagrimonas sp. C23AA]|uniref:RnfH family protein n=1 Tax=Oleiagrimonas sp. C23AA TaxID=2719047 RepID=UPI00141DC4C2|nr:RnfH family protein [Oleiagrimonas sp. C23AA]NII10410.1 RnfH family protein [Oleiagrimonas sp. C23AA]
MAEHIHIWVVYADEQGVIERDLSLPRGTTAGQALRQARLERERPQLSVGEGDLGVFGRRVTPGHVLHDGDRVEVYRPLKLDPMQARRQRAARR